MKILQKIIINLSNKKAYFSKRSVKQRNLFKKVFLIKVVTLGLCMMIEKVKTHYFHNIIQINKNSWNMIFP
jgi:hypothetical protein